MPSIKIYPQKHDIVESNKIQIKDIPLGYIDTSENEYSANVNIEADFLNTETKAVKPYDEFTDYDTLFFDGSGDRLYNIELKRNGNRYYYEPVDVTEFTPETFTCTAYLQRAISYTGQRNFNIKVATASTDMETKLLTVFGDAWKRQAAPTNVKINNGSMLTGSTTYEDLSEADFLFIDSNDGLHYEDGETEIDIEDLMDKHVNVWLSVDSFEDMLPDVEDATTVFTLSIVMPRTVIYKSDTIETIGSDKIRTFYDLTNSEYPSGLYAYEFFSNSALILNRNKAGFIIVTPKEIIDNASHYTRLIYEILMDVYCRSYFEVTSPHTWITTKSIDYVSYQSAKYGKNHGSINLKHLLSEKRLDNIDRYDVISISCDPVNVFFTSINDNEDITFFKIDTEEYTDPTKPANAVSYLTSSRNVIYYTPEDVYTIETKLNVSYRIDSTNTIYLTIDPYKSSSNKCCGLYNQTIEIPDNTVKQYYLCLNENNVTADLFDLIAADAYTSGKIAATIDIVCISSQRLYDVRVRGGGLPEKMPDDYDLLDIGNPNGRPYRLGGSYVIKMPLRYEKYKAKIQDAVEKHMSAGDVPILIFEDGESNE